MPKGSAAVETREIGVVVSGTLNMRLGAGTGYPIIKTLVKDDQVQVLAHEKGWLHVLHEGDVGYVASQERFIKRYTIHTVTDARKTDLDAATAAAADIRTKIKEQTAEVEQYTDQEKEIAHQLNETDLALHQARQAAAAISAELAAVTAEVAKLEEAVKQAQKEIDQNSGYAVQRLISLYKLSRLGETNLLASATSFHDLMRRQAAIERIISYDQEVLSDLVDKKNRRQELVNGLNEQKRAKETLHAEHQAAVATLDREKRRRKALLAEIQSKKETRLASIKYLKNASIQLDKTISALSRRKASAKEGDNPFSAYQGLLKMPVDGKVISTYGKYVEPHSGATNFRNGIEIRSKHGAPVRAVFAGETIYSSWLKGYGNVIIIAHGKDFHTVYAHAEELFRAKGEPVEAGEVIATVGDSGSMTGPALYFEIRRQGKPVDPLEWISKG